MKPVEVSLEQVLLARENRAGRQQRLLAQYGLPLVSFTMNMAGPVKDTPLSHFAFQAGVAALTKRLGGPVSCCLTEAVTGCEALLVYDRPAQALNLLRIVDQRPKRHAGELFFGAFKSLEHRAPHAEAKPGMLSDCEFHTHLLPLSEGLLTHYSILPIFFHSRSFSFFLPKRGEFSNFFENIFPRAGLFRMKSAYAGVFSAGGSDFPPLSRAKAASMRSVSASQVSLFMRPARRSAISIGLPTCTTMRRNGL